MRSSVTACTTMVWLVAAALLAGLAIRTATAAQTTREYEIHSIEPYKSDVVHLIEAYENLSNQYLSLVQHHLKNMDDADRQILTRLQSLEKKIDDLAAKVEKLTPANPPAQAPAAQTPPAAAPN